MVRIGSVRKLDNEFVIVAKILPDGTVMVRYEADRTNTLYHVAPDWLK